MKTDEWILTDPAVLSAYGLVLGQLTPQSVLDTGMLIKRYGGLSRHFESVNIPDTTLLWGIDLTRISLPVYETIYDRIILPEDFPNASDIPFFDLAVILKTGSLLVESSFDILMRQIFEHSGLVLTDRLPGSMAPGSTKGKASITYQTASDDNRAAAGKTVTINLAVSEFALEENIFYLLARA